MPEPITEIQGRIMMALALEAKGDRIEAARALEDAATAIRVEVRRDAMVGTVDVYQADGLQRFCGHCGRGIVIMAPATKGGRPPSFRIDRRYCSDACRQAAWRKRRPPKPAKVIYL